jgi:glycosyltransferase involved in cell wall biosynthesis
MRITFLLQNAYAIGGTIRTTSNLAAALAERGHDVEIASVFRHRDTPRFRHHPAVRLRPLVDLRASAPAGDRDHPLAARPSRIFPAAEVRRASYSELTDERVGALLAGTDADVLIGTRPGLNVQLARQGPRRAIRVAQEHLTLDSHAPALVRALRRVYPRLDAVVTTTRADAESYRRRMRLPGTLVTSVPNGVPDTGVPPSDCTAKVVVAAGRLDGVKRYQDLIRAFAVVAAARPEWSLRLYGGGAERDRLAALVTELGLTGNVTLMGPVTPIEPEFARGSILAVSSRLESFGMTIVEAMRVGVPVVSTDCPLGPGEIIDHGVDGLLVPPRDVDAMAAALLELIGDEERRRRMGRAALAKAHRYDPARVADAYLDLFERLATARAGLTGRLRGTGLRAAGVATGTAYAGKDAARAVVRRARRAVRGRSAAGGAARSESAAGGSARGGSASGGSASGGSASGGKTGE